MLSCAETVEDEDFLVEREGKGGENSQESHGFSDGPLDTAVLQLKLTLGFVWSIADGIAEFRRSASIGAIKRSLHGKQKGTTEAVPLIRVDP